MTAIQDFDLDTAVAEMTPTHLQCRDMRHTWRPAGDSWDANAKCYESKRRCTRCRTVRVMLISVMGEVLSSHYDYPDHYVVKGMGLLDSHGRDAIRLRALKRRIGEDV